MMKFRAWDNYEKVMLEIHGINYDAKGVWTKEMIDDEDNGDFISFSEIELMKSTGLYDKNDNEIFEGDIIDKGYSNLEIEEKIGYVQLDVGADSTGYSHEQWLGWITNNGDSLLDVCEHCTVIGNIYENEDLIK
ncbi:YopX family protein [Mammaliicoccus sciuri]|uniref:YopX family protein n=1 Tax=Mammaliicoccus sciuri TaxID=1296 RepID=UPI001E47A2D7|nr:YopX family protein [Mammaliicoccus sciuri]